MFTQTQFHALLGLPLQCRRQTRTPECGPRLLNGFGIVTDTYFSINSCRGRRHPGMFPIWKQSLPKAEKGERPKRLYNDLLPDYREKNVICKKEMWGEKVSTVSLFLVVNP